MRIFCGKLLQKCCFSSQHLLLFCKLCILVKIIASILTTTVYQLAFISIGFCNGSILLFIEYIFTNDSVGIIIKVSFVAFVLVTIISSLIFLVKKTPSKPMNFLLVVLNVLDIIAMSYSLFIFLDELELIHMIKVVNILFSGITIVLLIMTLKVKRGDVSKSLKKSE